MNLAALVRTATTSKIFFGARDRYYKDESDDEALIVRRTSTWAEGSVFLKMLSAYEQVTAMPGSIDELPLEGFQRALTAKVRAGIADPWPQLILRRMHRWGPNPTVAQAHLAIRNACIAFSILPQSVVLSMLRVLLNGLSTHARMQGGKLPCLLCGWTEGDCIEHLVQCPSLAAFTSRRMPRLASWVGPALRHRAICLQIPSSSTQLLREISVFADVVYTVHNHRRHGSRCPPDELAEARLRHLAVRFGIRLDGNLPESPIPRLALVV
jgi:hypothetical protein